MHYTTLIRVLSPHSWSCIFHFVLAFFLLIQFNERVIYICRIRLYLLYLCLHMLILFPFCIFIVILIRKMYPTTGLYCLINFITFLSIDLISYLITNSRLKSTTFKKRTKIISIQRRVIFLKPNHIILFQFNANENLDQHRASFPNSKLKHLIIPKHNFKGWEERWSRAFDSSHRLIGYEFPYLMIRAIFIHLKNSNLLHLKSLS